VSLRDLRDRLSVTQIAIASISVLAGQGMAWWSLALAAALVAWAFATPLPPEPSLRAQRFWTLLIFVALVASVLRAFFLVEVLDAGVDFLLLLIVQRFFNRQRAREHMQLLLLGSLLMVIGAVINTGLNYPLLFVGYLVSAVMTLLVNHLLSEGERLGPRIQAEVTKAAARSRSTLWRAAIQVAAFAVLGGLVVFLVFPRFGVGVFLRGAMSRDVRSGFSGDVALGEFGRIKSDPTVVARLLPLDGQPIERHLTWHLRGSSLDHYVNGHWTNGRDGGEPTPLKRIGSYFTLAPGGVPVGQRGTTKVEPVPIPGIARSSESIHVQVTLEDQGVDVLFVASDPIAVRLRPRGPLEQQTRIRGGYNRELRVDKPPGPVQYEFVARRLEPTPDELRAIGRPATDATLGRFVQRSDGLSEDVASLARSLTKDAVTRYDQVDALMTFLAGFEYSLELRESPRVAAGDDPIEGFLFETRAGHCEYFATALAVLSRELGIPSRVVNGYYGAEYNELGQYYAVRQADAHSWVELHFGSLGWITFDPTPPSGRAAGANTQIWPALAQAVDALRNTYLEYVIDYNLEKQFAALESLGLNTQGGTSRPRIDWFLVITWGLPLVVLGTGAWLLHRRRRKTVSPYTELYLRVLGQLAARGHAPLASESPTRFARRCQASGMPGAEAFRRFAEAYESVRFGPSSRMSHLSELRRLAQNVGQGIR